MNEPIQAHAPSLKDRARDAAASAAEGLREFPVEETDDQAGAAESPEPSQGIDDEVTDGSESSPEEAELPDYEQVLERLKRAEKQRDQQAGRVGDYAEKLQKLEAELEALKGGRQQAQEPEGLPLHRSSTEEVMAFARQHDPEFDQKYADDEYAHLAYQASYDVGKNLAAAFGQKIQEVEHMVERLQFRDTLAAEGIDQGMFNHIVAEVPGLSEQPLSRQLETVKRLGQSFGMSGQPSPDQGAPAPRRPLQETPMGGGSASDPRTRTLRDLHKAHESGDMDLARAKAKPLWAEFMKSAGL